MFDDLSISWFIWLLSLFLKSHLTSHSFCYSVDSAHSLLSLILIAAGLIMLGVVKVFVRFVGLWFFRRILRSSFIFIRIYLSPFMKVSLFLFHYFEHMTKEIHSSKTKQNKTKLNTKKPNLCTFYIIRFLLLLLLPIFSLCHYFFCAYVCCECYEKMCEMQKHNTEKKYNNKRNKSHTKQIRRKKKNQEKQRFFFQMVELKSEKHYSVTYLKK